jgi:DNA (cytosine-5)-methyltransferase 1
MNWKKTFCETLCTNHKGENIVQGSMLDLDLTQYKGNVDILQGGVPCQAFSQAGDRKGLDDPRGKLIIHFNKLHRLKRKMRQSKTYLYIL